MGNGALFAPPVEVEYCSAYPQRCLILRGRHSVRSRIPDFHTVEPRVSVSITLIVRRRILPVRFIDYRTQYVVITESGMVGTSPTHKPNRSILSNPERKSVV